MGAILIAITIIGIRQTNSSLICNGDFEEYGVSFGGMFYTFVNSNYSCWYNYIGQILQIQAPNSASSAILELSHNYQYILCQDVSLQVGSLYQLNFTVYHSIYFVNSTIIIKFNSINVFNHTTIGPSTYSNASGNITANSTLNQICFDSVFAMSPYYQTVAPCLDNISLVLISPAPVVNLTNRSNLPSSIPNQPTLSQQFQVVFWNLSLLLSFPFKLVVSLRCAYLILDDVWLYDYAEKNYTGLIEVIFQTITTVQLLKFQYLEKYLGWNQYKAYLGISNYTGFTVPKFVQLEDASSVLADSNFAFLVYSVPQKLIVCIGLHLLFRLLYNYRISKYIRKFYFLKTCLATTLLEENLAYFVFVCFLNMTHPFSFTIADKLSITFTILFLFSLLLFSLCFNSLVFKYLRKKSDHFADLTFRESAGFWYRTAHLMRNVLRAVMFSFFHYRQTDQLLLLCLVQTFIIAISLVVEPIYRIFRSKVIYGCHLIYFFLFILLNFALIAEDQYNESQIVRVIKETQQVILYSLIAIVVIMTMFDLFSFQKIKTTNLSRIDKYLVERSQKELKQKQYRISKGTKQMKKQEDQKNNEKQNQKNEQAGAAKKLKNNFVQIIKKDNKIYVSFKIAKPSKRNNPKKSIFADEVHMQIESIP